MLPRSSQKALLLIKVSSKSVLELGHPAVATAVLGLQASLSLGICIAVVLQQLFRAVVGN